MPWNDLFVDEQQGWDTAAAEEPKIHYNDDRFPIEGSAKYIRIDNESHHTLLLSL
jgi:hypothetical protein